MAASKNINVHDDLLSIDNTVFCFFYYNNSAYKKHNEFGATYLYCLNIVFISFIQHRNLNLVV